MLFISRFFFLISVLPVFAIAAGMLENDDYILEVQDDGRVIVTEKAGQTSMMLNGEFKVMWTERDPKINRQSNHPNYLVAPRVAVRWLPEDESIDDIMAWLGRAGAWQTQNYGVTITQIDADTRQWYYLRASDGKELVVTNKTRTMESTRPFSVGDPQTVTAESAIVEGRSIRWIFCRQKAVVFSAGLELPEGSGDPRIHYTVTPKKAGYVSVAYTGVSSVLLSNTSAVWQELETQSHRQFNYVMSEPDLKFPRALLTAKTGTSSWGLVVAGEECRFHLPTIENSRFGLMLEMENNFIKPVVLAPLLGGAESWMEAGKPWSFSFYFLRKNDTWMSSLAHAAQNHHNFRDMRDNRGSGSINQAIERIVSFIGNHNGKNYAMWDSQQKYMDYFVDKMWVFKPFSSLYGLSVAIITDDEDFFYRRGLPAAEFALSRPGNVFEPYDATDSIMVNTAVREVGSPYAGHGQLMSLHELLQGKSPVIPALASEKAVGSTNIGDMLANWRHTGNVTMLENAKTRARNSAGSSENDFVDILDVAMLMGEPAFIEKARASAYSVASQKLSMYPMPTEGEQITVEVDDKVPVHAHSNGRHHNIWGFPVPVSISLPQQTVDTWRVARIGTQAPAYPIEYWMNLNGGLMRVAGLSGDTFLRDLARWGMVGRFGTYPGDNRSQISLVPEADVVDAPPWDWNYATVNPGHAWDFVAQLMDFLVSDVFARSAGAIDFPAVAATNSSFRVRIYGAYPGEFYGDQGVYLWVPRNLLTLNSGQIDWIGGWKDGTVYLVLLNQSFEDQTITGTLNSERVEYAGSVSARSWVNNEVSSGVTVSNGQFNVTVPAKGIVALAIPANARTEMQARFYDPSSAAMGSHSYNSTATVNGKKVHAMLLKSGGASTRGFIYTEVLPEDAIAARLRWKQGNGDWQEEVDVIYPYEFSPMLEEGAGDLVCVLDIERADASVVPSPVIVLSEGNSPISATAPEPPDFPLLESDGLPDNLAHNLTLSAGFIDYLKSAANKDNYGLRSDGRYYPYSTAKGRRIAWRQMVWDKAHFATGITATEAEERFVKHVAWAEKRVIDLLAARSPVVAYTSLDTQQKEMLVDMMFTEGELKENYLEAVLAKDWTRMKAEVSYVRYFGHTPDSPRNKPFGDRFNLLK